MNFLDQLYEDVMNNYYRNETVIEFPSVIMPSSIPTTRNFRRYYHTDVHIRNMLDGWDKIANETSMQLETAVAGSVAIIYHDAVYDPTRTDNEERSAELMRRDMKDRLGHDGIICAERMILETKHTNDSCFVWKYNVIRDLDLRSIGGSRAEYRRNVWQIRQEYAMFSLEQFLEGRRKFLTHMLSKDNIFRTSQFQHLGDKAKDNIWYELRLISYPSEWENYFIKSLPITNPNIYP